MTKITCLLLLSLLVSCAGSRKTSMPATQSTSQEKQYTIILSMDAFRYDLAERSHTPTLDSLKGAGTYSKIFPVYPSNTFPSHYSMATGLHPDHHGIVNNKFYDCQTGQKRSVFDSLDVRTSGFWGGEPIWNTAERQGLKANIFMWPGSEVPINGRQATVWTRYSSKPTYYERANWVIDAMTRPEKEIPDLVMWYFEQPDAAMHHFGPTSREAIAQAEHIDSVLRYFFRAIRRSPVFDRINFIVTADHGMAELAPERYINLYPLLDTTQVVHTIPGTPYGLEVRDEYMDEALHILRKTKHLKAWSRDGIPARFHYGSNTARISNIVIAPDAGWEIDYRPQNQPLRRRGGHGFDNRDRTMQMVFYATGPAFRPNYRQRSFQNHNMYLLLCHLLGIEPAPNDCNWQQIRRMLRTE